MNYGKNISLPILISWKHILLYFMHSHPVKQLFKIHWNNFRNVVLLN